MLNRTRPAKSPHSTSSGAVVAYIGLAVLSFWLATGCAGFRTAGPLPALEKAPRRVVLDTIPFYPQSAYMCGPASLAMLLDWSGQAVDMQTLITEVYSPQRKGSLQASIVAAARRHGRIAYPIQGEAALVAHIADGFPVLVLQNLGLSWYPRWHYAVLIGYDLDLQQVRLHSGVSAGMDMPWRVFRNTWRRSDDWGLVVLNPDQMPVTAGPQPYLEALVGLEKARQWDAAATGYRTALKRWPENLAALMGLGNSHYKLGDLDAAEAAFRRATQLHPGSGAAFNNLAQVLYETGRKAQALTAIQRAIAIGGPLSPVYQKTLEMMLQP